MSKITVRLVAVLAVVLFAFGLNVGTALALPSVPTAPSDVTVVACDNVTFWGFVIFEYNCQRMQ